MTLDVLVVDDERDIRELISDILRDDGFTPRVANDSSTAIDAIDERVPSAVILDIWLQGSEMDGLGILEIIKRRHPDLPVIMISGHGNIETAINSIKLGAYDYVEKPFKEEKLLRLIKRSIEAVKLKRENEELRTRGIGFENELLGSSNAVSQLRSTIDRVAITSSRILISGQAGCGKEIVARQIHKKSKFKNGPFIILNAASISHQNFEIELFGEESGGGFKGGERKVGAFEKAHGGTLFIDEIGDMPLFIQSKLLKVLQQQNSFTRIGGSKPVKVDVRLIAATCKNLHNEIRRRRFREDLYYRLNVVPIRIPSLSERNEDIVPLAQYFIKRCSETLGITPRRISESAIASMESYNWPGNIRQLRNTIEQVLIMSPDDPDAEITAEILPPEILSGNSVAAKPDANNDIMGMPLRQAREMFERQYIIAQLKRFGGNVSRTSSFIGMERSAFHRKLKSLNIVQTNDEYGFK